MGIPIPILTTFVAYLLIVLMIGVYASKRNKNLSDFMLGGRSLNGAFVALGAGASDMSGWLLLGLPGAAYAMGIEQIWLPIGLAIGAFLNWHYVSGRLRVYTEIAGDSLTVPSFLQNRFRDTSRILSLATSIVILIFFTIYAAAGFVSGGLLFSAFSYITYDHALIISAVFIMSYTCIGGFLAVNWTDFFQGTLMFIALIILPVTTVISLGGWGTSLDLASAVNSIHLDAFGNMSIIGVISLLAWGLGYFGQPHILVRFMSAKSHRELPKAKLICMSWMIIALYGAVFTGLFGAAYFIHDPLAKPETVLLKLATTLFNPWVTGFFLAAVLSAIMSTIAAQLLVSSSALTEDFYHRFIRRNARPRELIWVSRATILLIASIALILASNPSGTVLHIVGYAWAGMGASFGPLILLSLFWPQITRNGALAGILVGTITVLVWKQFGYLGGIFTLYEIVPGFLLGSIAIIATSLLGKPVSVEIKNEFKYMLKRLNS